MFRNYFKTAWRNIIRSKGYSVLNVLGLATGMAVALLIGLWVQHEYSYDKFLPDYERLYQVKRNYNSNGDTLTFASCSLKLADALRNQIPEIEYVAEAAGFYEHGVMVGTKKFYMSGGVVNGNFLKMFRYPLLQGNSNAMNDAYSIALTESAAKALFGTEDPMNKMVRFDNKNDLKVTAILKDIPDNSSLKFKFLVPFSYAEQTNPGIKADRAGSYGGNGYRLYAKLKPGASYTATAAKIASIEKTETDNTNAMNSVVILEPLKTWHLYSNYQNGKQTGGFIDYVRMFSIIGILVLIIACINFINLTTARSEMRAKEVGVRKAIGSERKDLVFQFLTESFLLTLISFIFSIGFVALALPAFNALTGTVVKIPFSSPLFWIVMIGSLAFTALAAGSRPAFYLSAFNPVKVLKGTMTAGRSATLPRKILVVLQFSCSVALIISTIIIYQQVQYAKRRPIGYDNDRLVLTNMNDDLGRNYMAIKNELISKGIAEYVTQSSSPSTDLYWHSDVEKWPGKRGNETIEMASILVGGDYFKTMGIALAEGRDFATINDTTSVIFNEMAIKRMRIKNPIGQMIRWQGNDLRIVGIVKDALMASPFEPAEPTLFYCQPGQLNVMMYKLSPRINTQDAIAKLTAIFNSYNPAYPYTFTFSDASYAAKFNLEILVGKLAGIFAALAIFISCLGLFGLAAYVAEQRTKEIGIRKVLGASVGQLWLMLSKDFILLVAISCLIASPVALYFLQKWLQKYSYHVTIGAAVFIWAAVGAILITLITISFQSIRAAIMNPVKSLRSE